ncbi:hypothetical protein P692DRAFT_201841988 [Suillus brevipes Sb2]|nr:hypothetical protein P692DRAFT_201841988 [Suillus brevipes Sb2]
MCVDSCVVFCGPWRHHYKCPKCWQDQYDQNILQKSHRRKRMNNGIIDVYEDFFDGTDYLDALYKSKQSDYWIYIWVVFNHHPQDRYKKKYPKNVDLFLFPGLYHLAAVQHEGLTVWDTSRNCVFKWTPFLAFASADGPGMV